MKNIILAILFVLIFGSCTTTKYVEIPVDKVKIEYRDRHRTDTLMVRDSIIIKDKGDTVFQEVYKYIYRTKELRDTVTIIDTTTVVNTVEVVKEVNKLHNWQIILMVLGGVSIGFILFKLFKI